MKTKIRLFALMAAVVAFAACNKNDDVRPTVRPTPTGVPEVQNERTIVYAVGHSEGRTTLKTDSEWDAMLDRMCTMAAEGNTVTFYNMGARANAKGVTKEEVRFTTGDRQEIKEWMKEREKEGMTVSVSYDDKTGQWSGVAHASAAIRQDLVDCYAGYITCVEMPATGDPMMDGALVPALVTADSTVMILKKDGYIMMCGGQIGDDGLEMALCGTLTICQDLAGNDYLVLDISETRPEFIVGNWRMDDGAVYTLADDGNATLTQADGTTQSATWSIGDEGTLCCELLPGGGCWMIHWISATMMIISNGPQQIVFERV